MPPRSPSPSWPAAGRPSTKRSAVTTATCASSSPPPPRSSSPATGVGVDVAGALLVTVGDNRHRLRSEGSFAALCGVTPVQASSGQHQRHRLNRGGDRTANQALWRIALVRMATDQRTRDYVPHSTTQGRSKKETIRCLKRYIARELYPDLLTLHQWEHQPVGPVHARPSRMCGVADDPWDALGEQFVGEHYASLRGRVRTEVLHAHLLDHLPSPPLTVVDVGGGAGNQSVPLAVAGYDVTIIDPSPAMLERAAQRLTTEDPSVRRRVRLVEGRGEEAPITLEGERYGAVLCHGVVMYLDEPIPLVESICTLAAPGGLVSIVAKNVEVMAARHAHEGDWASALAAFDSDRQVNGLGVDTRGDRIDSLSNLLAERGVEPIGWYGVRLFTDGWTADRPATDDEALVVQVELEASKRDPYRQLSRLFHLLGRRR